MLDFELNRIENKKIGKIYKPLYVGNYISIEKALNDGYVKKNTELLLVKIDNQNSVAFSKHIMAFHHIAEGYLNEKPYMLTFCAICNSGMVMNPEVNGKLLHFYVAGVYNGMLLMADKETGTYWDHITGKGLLGKYENHQLEILQPHQVLLTKEVIEQYPNCNYGIPKMNFFQKLFSNFQNWKANTSGKGFLPPGFRKSMPDIDSRLPEMEMGIGVWINKEAKFYPISVLKENGNIIFDTISDQNLLLYISPITHIPDVLYVDEINTVYFDSNRLVFENGNYLVSGNLYTKEGQRLNFLSPNHLFSRWYGFVLTFPGCEII